MLATGLPLALLWLAVALGSAPNDGGTTLVAMLALVALSLWRIISLGDAKLPWVILLVFSIGLSGLFFFAAMSRSDGVHVPQLLAGSAVVLTLVVVEKLWTHRRCARARRQALEFADRVSTMEGVGVFEIEFAQPDGAKTRVSLVDKWTGQPGGPKTLWGSWPEGAVVAVDPARRVLDSAPGVGFILAGSMPLASSAVGRAQDLISR